MTKRPIAAVLVLGLAGVVAQVRVDAQASPAEMRRLAEGGDPQAQFNLGLMYDLGREVPEDNEEAVAWYRKAADQGVARAQYNLGLMYRNGEGVARDFEQAASWYRKAADQGLASAQYTLGLLYAYGLGVPRDFVEAYKWHSLAAGRATGLTQADYAAMRDTVARQITPAQRDEAEQRAAEWQAAFDKRQSR